MNNTIKLFILFLTIICFSDVKAQLNADFTASTTNGCAPLVVNFYDNSSGSPTSYSWNMGGTPSTLKNPSRTFTAPGTYTVSLTIYKGSSSDAETKTNYITVHPSPVVNFTATPLSGCSPLTVNFSDASTAGGSGSNTYSWYMGASVGFRTGANTTAVFTNAGSQSITLTVTNSFGCSTSHTKANYINVLPRPIGNFTATPVDFCSSPASTTFSGTASGNGPFSYTWIYGDALPNGSGTPNAHTYTAPPNTWSPKMLVTDANGCKDSITKSNYINIHYPTASISSNNSVCEGTPISFSSSVSPGGGTFSWSTGSTGSTSTHTFFTAGTHTVTLTYNYRGCTVTATKTITVHPKPIAGFITNPDSLCPAPVTTQFVPNGSYSSYLWDFGVSPAVTSTNPSPTFTYNVNGIYGITLMVTTANGCKDTVQNSLPIYDLDLTILPVAQSDREGCVPHTVYFGRAATTNIPGPNAVSYPYGVKTHSWHFGDASSTNTSTLASPSHTYTDTGIFTVTLTIVTNNGCSKTATTQVKVGAKPDTNFGAAPTRICMKNEIQFTDSTVRKIDKWEWILYDSSNQIVRTYSGKNPKIKYDGPPGVFTVTLITSHNGCKDSMRRPYYITVDSPKADFSFAEACDTLNKVFFKHAAVGSTSHVWLFGDPLNSTSTQLDPSFKYPALGSYTVRLATHNSRSGCRDTMTRVVTTTNRSMTLTTNDTTICQGDSLRLFTQLIGRPASIYQWYVNNIFRTSDSTTSYTHHFTTTGFNKVKVIITDATGCKDSVVKTNYIFVSKPTVSLTGSPLAGCIPMTVNFTDNSTVPAGATITNRVWNYGVGSNTAVTGTTTSYTYINRGIYDVKLIVQDNVGCKDSLVRTAYINAKKPIAAFSVKDTACINEQLTFANTSSSANSVVWYFGDGDTSIVMSPTHRYKAKGSYTVRLIVTDDIGCKDTMIIVNAVTIVKPDPSFTMSDSVAVCPPLLVQFTNTTPNANNYIWKTGLSSYASKNASEFYTARNKYDVTLIAIDKYGCTDSVTASVRILGYTGAFSYSPLIGCKPLTVNFTATTTNVKSMTWDFDDGVVLNSMSGAVSHIYNTPGSYVPRIIFEDSAGCRSSSDGADTIKVDAVQADFNTETPCEYNTATFVDTSKSYYSILTSYKWTFHDNTNSYQPKASKYYGPPGKYAVKLWVKNQRGCEDSITKDVTIHNLPIINAGTDTVICMKDTAQLNATGGIKYIWMTTPYLSCLDCPSPFAFPTEAFRFFVTGTDANGCSNKDSVWVRLKTKVTAITGPDEEICEKDTVTLTVKGGQTYKWLPVEGLNNSTSATPVASPSITTKYMVVSYEGRCIPDTDFVKVTIYPLPEVTATGAATIIAGNSTPISATGKLIQKFRWEPYQSLSCSDCPDPTASPSKTTEYTIKVYTDFGCVDSDKVTITVLCDKSQIFMPNTFTPNGDGQNDIFYPRGNGIDKVKSFRIYNRWGQTVFERNAISLNDPNSGWDGNYSGSQLPPDVFVYILETLCDDGQIMIIKGDISLVR